MKRNSKDHQLALNHFLKYWAKFTIIQPYHAQWLSKYAKYASYKRGACIYDFSWEEEKIIYVSQGILGRVNYYLDPKTLRSEEHTSELQSRENLVCRLLLEKKKTN